MNPVTYRSLKLTQNLNKLFFIQIKKIMKKNKEKYTTNNESKKKRSLFSKILRIILISLSAFLFGLAVFSGWIYFSVFAGPDQMDISEFHPFKSPEAKIEYLKLDEEMAKNWPVQFDEKTVTTSYGKTFMRVSGPINGEPLVLLPGGGSSSLIWHANIEALSSVYRTYALDNIYDFGRSVYTKKMESHEDFNQWLDELFDTLSLGNNIRIMGYSYGGWVTGNYAVKHSERIERVVLVAPAFSVEPVTKNFIYGMFLGLLPCKKTRRKALYASWKDLVLSGPEGEKIADNQLEFFHLSLQSFKFKMGAHPNMLSDDQLKSLNMPVLFLIGENETVCNPYRAIKRLNTVAPKIKTELFLETGHDLIFTHTEEVDRMILEFLK